MDSAHPCPPTFTLHSPVTVVESGSLGGPDPSPAGSEGICMVGEKEAQVMSWRVVTNDLWVNGLALLTFDP